MTSGYGFMVSSSCLSLYTSFGVGKKLGSTRVPNRCFWNHSTANQVHACWVGIGRIGIIPKHPKWPHLSLKGEATSCHCRCSSPAIWFELLVGDEHPCLRRNGTSMTLAPVCDEHLWGEVRRVTSLVGDNTDHGLRYCQGGQTQIRVLRVKFC